MSSDEIDEKKMAVIPFGSFLTITTGAYSGYCVRGVFRAVQDIDADKLRDEWLSIDPKPKKIMEDDTDVFLGWVARKGLLEPIDSYEWHLGDYGGLEEVEVSKADEDDAVAESKT
jgi:hypothetical protein